MSPQPFAHPYDAMTGNPSPLTIVETAGTSEMEAILFSEPSRSFRSDLVKHLAKDVLPLRNENEPAKKP